MGRSNIKPINKTKLEYQDILDLDIYQNVWLPVGDEKQIDVQRLIEQGRIDTV